MEAAIIAILVQFNARRINIDQAQARIEAMTGGNVYQTLRDYAAGFLSQADVLDVLGLGGGYWPASYFGDYFPSSYFSGAAP